MSLELEQVRLWVVRPALQRIALWSPAAENLVLGTGLHESHYQYLDQIGANPGPAYGLWQMEKATYEDLWGSIPGDLFKRLLDLGGYDAMTHPPIEELHGNLFLGAAMCRVLYRRVKEPLPEAYDFHGMALYWKRYYNTPLGKGQVLVAAKSFEVVCGNKN